MTKRKQPDDGYTGVRILPSGTIAYSIREPDHAGVMRQRTVTRDEDTGQKFRSEYQASRARGRHQARIDTGRIPRSREPLSTYAATWLAGLRDVRPSTVRVYTYAVANMTEHIGDIVLAELRPSDVKRFQSNLSDRGLSPKSIQVIRSVLHLVLESALADEIIPYNPADRTRGPVIPPTEITSWTPDEVRRFLVISDRHEYAPLWRMALETGMRIGELRALTWHDIDLRERFAYVRRTATVDAAGRPIIGDAPKTGSSRRAVPLSTMAADQLGTLRSSSTSMLVFPGRHGDLLHPRTIRGWLDQLSTAAGVSRIRVHDLRHTAATMMLSQGTPAHVVAGILGHAHPSMTLNVYAHSSDDAARNAIADLERFLNG